MNSNQQSTAAQPQNAHQSSQDLIQQWLRGLTSSENGNHPLRDMFNMGGQPPSSMPHPHYHNDYGQQGMGYPVNQQQFQPLLTGYGNTQHPSVPYILINALSGVPQEIAAQVIRNFQNQTAPPQPYQHNMVPGMPVNPWATSFNPQQSVSSFAGQNLNTLLQHQQQGHSVNPQGMQSLTGYSHARPTEFSKYCQVDYAKKVKPENCNAILYIWGFLAQILLSRKGLAAPMSDQEQNGRIQHLMHMLELCAMQSSLSDFNSQAWLCAKNYSDRVFTDLDSGATTWQHIGPKMHPTNLMQAMSSFPKQVSKKETVVQPQQGSPCAKWSTCTTEDKCQYEVDTGRVCNRPHYCAYCMKTYNQMRRHKESECRKKESATNSNSTPSNATSNQPT